MTDWQDMIVGDRMAVDNEFAPNVQNSPFSRQQWGLIMTATTLEIRHADDLDSAHIAADTSNLAEIMPEVERVAEMTPMEAPSEPNSGSGIFDSVRNALGLGNSAGGSDREKIEAATQLVDAYAAQLQQHLEANGRWEDVCKTAAEQS